MQPTVYQYDPSKSRPYEFFVLALCLVFGPISLMEFLSEHSESGTISWFYFAMIVVFSVFPVLYLAKLAGLDFRTRKSPKVYLSLDGEGLTYARGGMGTRRWSWAELSVFEYVGPDFPRCPAILFRPVAPAGWDRWTMHVTSSGLRARLPNIFDESPEEIAAKLNEYRDRALGTGAA